MFYDAGSMQWWGRFLEAKTTSANAEGPWGTAVATSYKYPEISKPIGMGSTNSWTTISDTNSVYSRLFSRYFEGGKFVLPSKDELDALYNYWVVSKDPRLKYTKAPMWTSSQATGAFAWYQLFQDGTQFTDANGIIRGLKSNKDYLKSPQHVGSGFAPTEFHVIGVNAFPITGKIPPADFLNVVNATSTSPQCSNGGANTVCAVGDIGPGGGIVFYDAGSDQYWGRYLEMAPKSCEGVRLPWRPAGNSKTVYTAAGSQSAAELRVLAKGVGMGKVNTRVITLALGAGAKPYAAKFAEDLKCGGKDDWFLPSKDELDLAFNRLAQNRVAGNDTPVGGFNKGFYWTSTDYNNATAWTQYFMDGQQFDRVQTMDGNRTPPNPFRVRPIRAFGTNNVVKSCAQGGECELGDTGPGGGTVFYVAPDLFIANGVGNRYLEFANENSVSKIKFCPPRSRERFEFGTKPYIGAGFRNTILLRNACPGYSPSLFSNGGKSDWFIPSIDELQVLMDFVESAQLDSREFGDLWSSTATRYSTAWSMRHHASRLSPQGSSYGIRLIRAFG